MMETEVQLEQPIQPPIEQASTYKLPPLTLLMVIVEFTIILSMCWISVERFRNWDVRLKISGDEFSYLINGGAIASEIFHKTGAIPLWNPFVRTGEPLIENPFSFVLNPFMSLPFLAWGAYNGSKFALVLHILGLGVGGWTLGRVLRLRSVGRTFLGLVLATNGSLVGAISGGFFQMTLTQTYIPWILAGMIGTLYLKRRWPVALLAIATTLQMLGGTYWYVLPSAITCGLLALFTFQFARTRSALKVDAAILRRLALAAAFVILLGMVRLLPQFVHSAYVVHPDANLGRLDPLDKILDIYFNPTLQPPPYQSFFMFYHYAMPFWFFAAVVVLRVLLYKPAHSIITSRWRIVVPLLLSFLLYSLWAQEKTPLMEWLYSTFTVLKEWRFLARMMAAATPMLITLTAIWFDDIVYVAKPIVGEARAWVTLQFNARRVAFLQRLPSLSQAIVIVMVVMGAIAAFSLQTNWRRLGGLSDVGEIRIPGIEWLREQYPTEFLSVHSSGFFNYFTHWATLTRGTFGNPDYRPRGDFSTLGNWTMMPTFPEWAVGIEFPYVDALAQNGYLQVEGSPTVLNKISVWHKADAISYSFLVSRERLATFTKLSSEETIPTSYYHRINSVLVPVSRYPANSVLVVQETAFPGWEVTINGQPAKFESVGELLGVVLPDAPADGSEVVVEFSYYPHELYLGGYITLLTALLMALYLLRVDRPLRRLLPDDIESRVTKRLTDASKRIMGVLNDEKLLNSNTDED